MQRLPCGGAGRCCRAGAAVLALGRIAHDAALRALGLSPQGRAVCPRRRAPARARQAPVRQLPLQPLQHQYPAPDPGDVRAGVRGHRAPSGAGTSAPHRCPVLGMTARAPTPPGPAQVFDARELIASLPKRPGVYRMLNAARRDALRRQGARPEEARRQLFPENGPCAAHGADGRAGGAGRDDGDTLGGRGAAAGEQPDQGPPAALQRCSSATTRAIPTSALPGEPLPAAALPPRQAGEAPYLLRPVSQRGCGARRHRGAAEGVSSCAPASRACLPTARARACSTRSSAAPAPASA